MTDLLFEYTFVVFLDKISLEPTKSNIMFQCDDIFFAKDYLEYLELQKKVCHQSNKIPGQEKHIISRMKESEVKKYLDKYLFNINLFDNDVSFGNALVDLSPFFRNHVEEMPFGLKHTDQVKISDKDGVKIGSIDFQFTLTKEECFTCKSCKLYNKVSTILKHFSKPNNNCKCVYTEKELEEFNENLRLKDSNQMKGRQEILARKSLRKYKQKRTFLLSTRQKNIFLSAL